MQQRRQMNDKYDEEEQSQRHSRRRSAEKYYNEEWQDLRGRRMYEDEPALDDWRRSNQEEQRRKSLGNERWQSWGPHDVVCMLSKHHFSEVILQGFLQHHITGSDMQSLTDEQLWKFGMEEHNIRKYRLLVTELRMKEEKWHM